MHGGATSQMVSFLVIEALSNLKIYVKDVEGDRIERASVFSTTTPSGQSSLSGSTDIDGTAYFSDVKTGRYTFKASKSGYVPKSGSVTAETGEANELSLTFEKEPSERIGIPDSLMNQPFLVS